jgi:hypothetical protein
MLEARERKSAMNAIKTTALTAAKVGEEPEEALSIVA